MRRHSLVGSNNEAKRQDAEHCREVIMSEDYIDVVRELDISNPEKNLEQYGAECYQVLTSQIGIFHIPRNGMGCDEIYKIQPYVDVPNVFGLDGNRAVTAAGISAVTALPALALTGRDVLIGIIDTGIDYTHPAFIYEDNTSKILSIWDQTGLEASPPENFLFGTEYNYDLINEALQSDDPRSIVPEVDEIGHGTFLAGIAAGRENKSEQFIGAAPDASLVVVKLKPAKECLREFYSIKKGAIAFQSNDVLLGAKYVLQKAAEAKKPAVILVGLGDNMGPHDGTTFTERTLEQFGNLDGVVVIISAGNEANKSHHYKGMYGIDDTVQSIQFNVAQQEMGFYMNFWNYIPDRYTVSLTSPRGTDTGRIPPRSEQKQEITFIAESSEILVEYATVEARTGDEAIFIRLKNPSAGIWTLNVFGEIVVNGEYHIWLPREGFIEEDTFFLLPDPYTTANTPATNKNTITVGAYNDVTNSLYIPSGRGPTRGRAIKPDIVAPGVNVIGPFPNNRYGTMSGTSIAAAITAGASALLLQWGVIEGNDPNMDTVSAKTLLIRGANRRPALDYPNNEWGYGELNLLNTFKLLQS